MKVLLFISTLILVVSCGKYERPFISFQSPETRLVDKTWGCTKAVSEDGTEFEIEDRITFSSDGTFERITSHWPLNPLYYTFAPDPAVAPETPFSKIVQSKLVALVLDTLIKASSPLHISTSIKVTIMSTVLS